MIDNWNELKEQCLNCKKCGLCETRTNVVFGVGNPIRIDGYSQLFMMLEITIQGVFYGMGRTMPPAVISVTCNYLRIPMALLFVSWGWGLPGIWWSISITSTMKGIICLIWFMLIKKKALNYQAV